MDWRGGLQVEEAPGAIWRHLKGSLLKEGAFLVFLLLWVHAWPTVAAQ